MLETYKTKVTIGSLREGEIKFKIERNSDFISYPHFIEYFENIGTITEHNLIIGINFTYGWMPTIFSFKSEANQDSFKEIVKILNKVKQGGLPTISDLDYLKPILNSSLVGTSKLLHFINPQKIPIWDSNVYRYLTGNEPYEYRIGNSKAYLDYIEFCNYITNKEEYKEIYANMESKIPHPISKLRSVELIMYHNGKKP